MPKPKEKPKAKSKAKPKVTTPPRPPPVPEWDPSTKEPWHLEFEREPINDDRWTCIVAAAIQTEDKDEECVLTYTQCVNTGLRRAVKIISVADVIAVLKEHAKPRKDSNTSKTGKAEKNKTTSSYTGSYPLQMIEFAAKYATIFSDLECQLPPDLMAAVVKSVIFRLKEENILQKKIDAARAKKLRERNIRAKFIREKQPFEKRQEELKSLSASLTGSNKAEEPINDEPIDGPDLYIMLVDFFDVSYLKEMLKINIPLVALLKIATTPHKKEVEESMPSNLTEVHRRKYTQLHNFWQKLKHDCLELETTTAFKDVAMMQYNAPPPNPSSNEYRRLIFDELTWTLYSAHCIYREHQKYLQEMLVQRVILSLETLDLSKCNIYNKLCDALITGEPLTPLMVLYAIVEQVVVGVPETESLPLEYHAKHFGTHHSRRRTLRKRRFTRYSPTILEMKDQIERSSEKHKDWSETSTAGTSTIVIRKRSSPETSEDKLSSAAYVHISETLLDQVLSERKTEKELKAEKKWKTPFLCSHGDSVFIQSFYCDPRLFDAETVVRRFMGNSYFFQVWNRYPELTPEEKVYYDYHFYSLWKVSGQREDLLKTKIYFLLVTKLMGIAKSYLYKGADENISLSLFDYDKKSVETEGMLEGMLEGTPEGMPQGMPQGMPEGVPEDIKQFEVSKGKASSFSNYFFKTFIVDIYSKGARKAVISIQDSKWMGSAYTQSEFLMNILSHLNIFHLSHCSLPFCHKVHDMHKTVPSGVTPTVALQTLYFILDCIDLTNLTEDVLVDNEFHLKAIKNYKYYEKLESNLMIQRMLEAAEHFNTIQYWHFLPTDTLIINMHDDFDHRGLFCTNRHGVLPTPVALRDFYNYVYPEISDWLVKENQQHSIFLTELAEKLKAAEEKEDAQYWARLNEEFENMSPEERQKFLETVEEPQIDLDEIACTNLPRKRKPSRSKKISFITTNLIDLTVENNRNVNEFHSKDGTKVNVSLDSWLYTPPTLLKLEVKRADFLLYYYHWLDQETNTSFTFRTVSGIIFSFYKNNEEEDDFKYYVTMSWPTGLLIRPVWTDSTIYVKQYYLKPCRKGWKIEDEESRCFLKNGQIIVFKSNGDYDVLCASGTKYSFYDSTTIPRYEIVSTTGEVWEIRTKGPCRNRKKSIGRNKIFIGVDPKTQEAFYKREDGVQCMLWQSGRLVTTYPDGTKITSTPYFEEEEVKLEWTEEEKAYFEQLANRYKSEQSVQEPRSRTILRHSSTKTFESKSFEFEGFTAISCAYLSEHPKYSTVHINRSYPHLKVTLPENLSIAISEDGAYEIQKDKHYLKVQGTKVVFQTICYDCTDTSTLKLNLDTTSDVLCSFVDFFQKAFFMLRSGGITFQEHHQSEESQIDRKSDSSGYTAVCATRQTKSLTTHQRCFVLERDLSGIEFLHEDYVTHHITKHSSADPCHLLFHTDRTREDSNGESAEIAHTLTGQYSKAGYEKWVMNYEDPLDSLPVNIKKKDLREMGTKQVTKNLFKFPFPKSHNCIHQQQNENAKRNINPPKLIVSRTILCLSPDPNSVISELRQHISEYQKQALKIFHRYKGVKSDMNPQQDSRHVEMRLKRIAITLSQSLHMYPHLCEQLPSTEKDIHYFGHLINKAQELKFQDPTGLLPECKQIPVLPKFRKFDAIDEEDESAFN